MCPGMSPDGSLHERGVPAPLVTAYLEQRGIVVARTTDFIILFLFSIGITKARHTHQAAGGREEGTPAD